MALTKWFRAQEPEPAIRGQWFQEDASLERELAALKLLGLAPEVNQDERLTVRDDMGWLVLEMTYSPNHPLEPPAVKVVDCTRPEALIALIETAGLVGQDMTVKYTRLHPWNSKFVGAYSLAWCRDILTVAAMILPASQLAKEAAANPPQGRAKPANTKQSNEPGHADAAAGPTVPVHEAPGDLVVRLEPTPEGEIGLPTALAQAPALGPEIVGRAAD